MLLSQILWATILIPLIGAAGLAFLPIKNEKWISRVAIVSAFFSSAGALAAVFVWVHGGFKAIETPSWVFVTSGRYHFNLGLRLDGAAAAFLFLVEFTSGTVIRFSRVYLHRDSGYRRFFAIVLMFQGAMALLTLASNLDLLFCAWEMVGLASFLLITFYYERRAPVRNALKVFSIYRLADVGMLLGAFLEHLSPGASVGFLLVLAAAGKSAQFPFSFWIVKAMEGPTPSSALFYGALSVHAGAYLLLRTYDLWGGIQAVHLCVGILGLTTAILCSMFSRVRHTIKGQIGYASVVQVGLIFVELALGLKNLALFHMVSNALLRCYQLLVSPSAVAYLLRQQSSSAKARPSEERSLFQRIFTREARSSLYVFAISEGYLEDGMRLLFWSPLRVLGKKFEAAPRALLAAPVLVIGVAGILASGHLSGTVDALVGIFIFAFACIFSISAISSLHSPLRSMKWLALSSAVATASVFVGSKGLAGIPGLEYSLGIGLSYGVASLGFNRVTEGRRHVPPMAGLTAGHPAATWAALIGALGIAGFPFLPTFFGEDILLHAAFQVHPVPALALSCLFALNGYAAVRCFALTFLGSAESQASLKF